MRQTISRQWFVQSASISHQFVFVIFSVVQTENLHYYVLCTYLPAFNLQSASFIYSDDGNLWRGARQHSSAQPKLTLRPSWM